MKKRIIPILTAALLMTGCGGSEQTEVSETSAEETTTRNPYLLVRGWDGDELLESVFFLGEYHPLPLDPETCPDFMLVDGRLVFPDGSSAEAELSGDGMVTALRFDRDTAPADLSVYGVGFDAVPEDIPSVVGIANTIYGSEDTVLTYSFFGGGIDELTFVFTERSLTRVRIAAQSPEAADTLSAE